MKIIPKSVENLIEEFAKLPGIGPKTAQRLTFYLLRKPAKSSEDLGKAAISLKNDIQNCVICCNYTDGETCDVCSDKSRDTDIICVVGEPLDVVAIEKTGSFKGLYHVLGGVISPIDGIGPDELYIAELVKRIKTGNIKEILIATNPTIEGETTSLYIQKQLLPHNIQITRLAHGIPIGGDLEYADEITLSRAIENRQKLK
ncbi:MAG: recombination mediator RecR [bacterium]